MHSFLPGQAARDNPDMISAIPAGEKLILA